MAVSVAVRLSCPKCKRVFEPIDWHGDSRGCCRRCRTDFEFIGFQALHAGSGQVPALTQDALPDEASCFYHAGSRAEVVCEGCGRFLCPICSIEHGGRKLCPTCIEQSMKKAPEGESGRLLWDQIALAIAVLPLLLWPFTLLTAPAALGVAIVGWNKPGSLIRGRRLRLVLALVFSSIQILVWITVFVMLILAPKAKH